MKSEMPVTANHVVYVCQSFVLRDRRSLISGIQRRNNSDDSTNGNTNTQNNTEDNVAAHHKTHTFSTPAANFMRRLPFRMMSPFLSRMGCRRFSMKVPNPRNRTRLPR